MVPSKRLSEANRNGRSTTPGTARSRVLYLGLLHYRHPLPGAPQRRQRVRQPGRHNDDNDDEEPEARIYQKPQALHNVQAWG